MSIDTPKFRNKRLGEVPDGSYVVDEKLMICPDFAEMAGMENVNTDRYGTQTHIDVGQVIEVRRGGEVGNIRIKCGGVEIYCSPNIVASLSEA